MISRATRTLVNLAAVIGGCWLVVVFYEAFRGSGLWHVVDRWLADDTVDSTAGVFAVCMFAGWIPIMAVAWLVWRVFLRGRVDEDFPVARVRE
jgi:hypothetical protein